MSKDSKDNKDSKDSGDPVVIKKYANRRLYNTASSSYVTLDDLSAMVKAGEEFVVHDAKTKQDITRSVLTQIIFEEEAKGENLLPISFLRQLIGFYGDSMQAVVPSYLDHAMNVFIQGQESLHEQVSSAFGGVDAMKIGQEMARQNMAMFEQAMGMFVPGMSGSKKTSPGTDGAPEPVAAKAAENKAEADKDAQLDLVKNQLAAMQKQLDALSGKN